MSNQRQFRHPRHVHGHANVRTRQFIRFQLQHGHVEQTQRRSIAAHVSIPRLGVRYHVGQIVASQRVRQRVHFVVLARSSSSSSNNNSNSTNNNAMLAYGRDQRSCCSLALVVEFLSLFSLPLLACTQSLVKTPKKKRRRFIIKFNACFCCDDF